MNRYLFIPLAFFLTSCFSYKDLEYKGISNISFSNQNGCDPICIYIDIYNPNPYNIKLQKGLGELSIKENVIGDLSIKKRSKLKSSSNSTIQLMMSSSNDQIFKTLFSSLEVILGKKVKLNISGKIKASVYGLTKTISFDENQMISLKELIK